MLADEVVRLRCLLPDTKIVTREPIPPKVVLKGDAIPSTAMTAEIVVLQEFDACDPRDTQAPGSRLIGQTPVDGF